MGWLTPNDIPTATLCRRLVIPSNPLIIAAVSGALLDLTYSSNWSEFGEVTPDEISQAMLIMYQNFLNDGNFCMIGQVFAYATTDTPENALKCDGATYGRETYPELYSAIDSVYRIDADNFRVPDLQGRAPIGTGNGSGLSSRSINQTGGSENVTLTESQIPSHAHTTHGHLSGLAVAPGELPVSTPGILPDVTGNTGGGGSHENMPPFIALNYAIWYR